MQGHRATKLLELVHSDVCGPMHTRSLGGSDYFVIFVDDYSWYTVLYCIKRKSEVFLKFKEYKQVSETQTGYKLQKLRSDNGGEYQSLEF